MRRTVLGFWIAWSLAALLCGCSRPSPAEPGPASAAGSEPPQRQRGSAVQLDILSGPAIQVLESTVPTGAHARLSVERPGDPLDGLELSIPQGSFAQEVTLEISHAGIAEGSDLAGLSILSPLIAVDSGGAAARGAVGLRIPVSVPEDRFPMAFFIDDAGALEAVPLLAYDSTSVLVATQHFSKLIVTAEDFEALRYFEVDTGFRPGKDTWQFENRGTYRNPEGICWGMNVSSLWYYLEEPARRAGQALWGTYDNELGAPLATPHYWQDDVRGLMIADSIQYSADQSERDRTDDIVRQLEEEARAAGLYLDLRLNADEIAFYSLVTAMARTDRPQLLSVRTADQRMRHSLVAYRLDGTTVYVADPNDNQSSGPERTITFKDGQFSAYVASEQKDGRTYPFPVVRFRGQSALTQWSQVGAIWGQGAEQPAYPTYDLAVVERGASGEVTERVLQPGETLRITSDELELRVLPQQGLEARIELRHHQLLDEPSRNPLPLVEGPNLVGVLVEGRARWQDEQGEEQSAWRWLGFHYLPVIVELDEEEPDAAGAAGPPAEPEDAGDLEEEAEAQEPAPTGSGPFSESDCLCLAGRLPAGETQSYSEGHWLKCSHEWPYADGVAKLVINGEETDRPEAMLEALQKNMSRVCGDSAECTDQYGVQYRIVEDSAIRFTRVSFGPREGSRWLGHRGVIYRDRFYFVINPSIPGPFTEAEMLDLLDDAEQCAREAIDRYLGD